MTTEEDVKDLAVLKQRDLSPPFQELRPIVEVGYLNTENTWRYRAILRYCFSQHEKLRHYVYPEDIYQELRQNQLFAQYTEDQLQQDLKQLVDWKNLVPRQETGRVASIEDFKRKKFRYQCSAYTIEIERMVVRLEQLGSGFGGGSLEVTLFGRLLAALQRLIEQGMLLEAAELNQTWEDLYGYFRDMVQNASDYLAHLKSDKVEEQMMTEAFVVYKNSFTQYLQNFILSMQRTSFKIEGTLRKASPEVVASIAARLADYQLGIPRLEAQPSRREWIDSYQDRYRSLAEWFLGRGSHPSELVTLQNESTETIRRIARFAQRVGERQQAFRSRRHDYLHVATWFAGMNEVRECHKLSALLFGVPNTRHFFAEARLSDDIDSFVWAEPPTVIIVTPRVVGYREKSRPGAVLDRTVEKRAALREYIIEQKRKEAMLEALIDNHKISLADLPEIDPFVRKTLLAWITRCMQTKNRQIQTETGRVIRLIEDADGRRICLRCSDGALEMPSYTIMVLPR